MSRRHKGQLGSATTLNIPLQPKTRIPNRFTARLQNKIFRNTVLMSLSAFTCLLQCCVAGLSPPNIHAHPTKITQRPSMHNMLRFFKTCRTKLRASCVRSRVNNTSLNLTIVENFLTVAFTTSAGSDMHRPYQKGKRAALQNMPTTHLRTPRRLQRPRCPRGRSCFLVLRRLPENSSRRRRTSHRLLTCHRIKLHILASGRLAFRDRFLTPRKRLSGAIHTLSFQIPLRAEHSRPRSIKLGPPALLRSSPRRETSRDGGNQRKDKQAKRRRKRVLDL